MVDRFARARQRRQIFGSPRGAGSCMVGNDRYRLRDPPTDYPQIARGTTVAVFARRACGANLFRRSPGAMERVCRAWRVFVRGHEDGNKRPRRSSAQRTRSPVRCERHDLVGPAAKLDPIPKGYGRRRCRPRKSKAPRHEALGHDRGAALEGGDSGRLHRARLRAIVLDRYRKEFARAGGRRRVIETAGHAPRPSAAERTSWRGAVDRKARVLAGGAGPVLAVEVDSRRRPPEMAIRLVRKVDRDAA